jgi:hypothetical protein
VLGAELGGPFHLGRGPGGWWLLHEPELHFGADILVPDLAGWRRERLAAVPDAPYATLPPDGVCELLSPGHRGHRSHEEARDLRARARALRVARESHVADPRDPAPRRAAMDGSGDT